MAYFAIAYVRTKHEGHANKAVNTHTEYILYTYEFNLGRPNPAALYGEQLESRRTRKLFDQRGQVGQVGDRRPRARPPLLQDASR